MASLQTNKRLEALAVFFQIMVFLNRRRPVSVSPSAKFFHSDTLIVAPFAVSETNTIRLPLNDANSGEAAPDIFVFPVIKAAETYKNNIHHLCGSEVVCVCVCVCAQRKRNTEIRRDIQKWSGRRRHAHSSSARKSLHWSRYRC